MERAESLAATAPKMRRLPSIPLAVVWGALTIAVVVAYGLLGYFTMSRSSQQATLRAELKLAEQDSAGLIGSLAAADGLRAGVAEHQAGLDQLQGQFLRGQERILVVEALADLAVRAEVVVDNLALGELSTLKVGGQELSALGLSMSITGEMRRVRDFIEAAQSGMLPGMTVRRLNVTEQEGVQSAVIDLVVYSMPSTEPERAALPSPLTASGPAVQSLAGVHLVPGAIAPLMAWEVGASGDWEDALRAVAVTHAGSAIGDLLLYAEAGGDATFAAWAETLIARAAPGPDGVTVLRPSAPYAFRAAAGQRFYLAVDVRDAAPSSVFTVTVPAGAITFTSTLWPPMERDAVSVVVVASNGFIGTPAEAGDDGVAPYVPPRTDRGGTEN